MRLADQAASRGMVNDLPRAFSKDETLEMFSRMCRIRSFERNVKRAYDLKLIKCPIYLSLGEESIAAALSVSFINPYIFAQHRAHDLYVAYGGNLRALRDELLHLPSGCAGGMGGSASIHSPEIGMIGHDGHMGTQIPIAMGYTLLDDLADRPILAVMGDASAEEDYIFPTLGWAAKRKAPILFVCFDNNLSILTEVAVRRNWTMASVAEGFGLSAVDITDDPWLIMFHVSLLRRNSLPAFLNIHTVRHLWHAGTGIDGEPEWNRYQLVLEKIKSLGFYNEAKEIEVIVENEINSLWARKVDWEKSCLR